MEALEYETLAAYETWYWWYRAQREALVDAVRRLSLPPAARVLDAGCGTGCNVGELNRVLGLEAHGVDLSCHAAAMWNGDSGGRRCLGSVNKLPYADGSFDAVISVDVLQAKQVDPEASMSEMARVTRRGGRVVILAPAYQWMLSSHDRAVHSVRRFTRLSLRSMAVAAGLTVERSTHLFPVFFPMIAATRLARKVSRHSGGAPARSDLSPLPRWMNATLLACARAEFTVVRHMSVPFGSTILAVARKDQP